MTGETFQVHGTTEIADGRCSRSPRLTPWVALTVLALAALVAAFGSLLAPFGESKMVSTESFSYPPTAAFLGTDYLGRDLLSRLLNGARVTLGISLLTTV
jgi:peptide/nickel transport system permease protein